MISIFEPAAPFALFIQLRYSIHSPSLFLLWYSPERKTEESLFRLEDILLEIALRFHQ